MYHIGEPMVYGQVGVCKIKDISIPPFCKPGEQKQHSILEPQGRSGTIFVPADAQVSMRPVLSRGEGRAADRPDIPSTHAPAFDNASVPELKHHYSEALSSHDCERPLMLIISICAKKQNRRKTNQKIGVIDEDVIRRAEKLLYSDFSFALGIPASLPKYIASRMKAR